MNYLGHLYLADGTPESLLGNLLGDFLKGVSLEQFPDPVRRGIQQHLRVDAFTDSHPLFRRSRARVQPPHRRYAGVLVDVFYDHFLARHWHEYSPVPLPTFAGEFYTVLEAHQALLPEPLRRMAPRMAAEDWLCSYARLDGIDRTLRRLSRRLSRENGLGEAIVELEREYAALETDFRGFFPDLIAHVRS